METTMTESHSDLITRCYTMYRNILRGYLAKHLPYPEEADDMVQETFLHLMEYKQMLNEETIRSFLFTIARNLLIDYLRLCRKREEYYSYIYDCREPTSSTTEQTVLGNELVRLVDDGLRILSDKRRKVYALSLDEGLTVGEIADRLQIAYRTAECHLFVARKSMRKYVAEHLAG